MRRAVLLLIAAAAAVAMRVAPSLADDTDFLKSSPGELSKSHASLDNQGSCHECHDDDNSITPGKCLGCHDHGDLKKRIDAGEGLHVSVKIKGRPCELCHKEHRGRSFDPMGWDTLGGPKKLDHALTGFPLEAKHATLDCSGCHKSKDAQGLRTYLSVDRTCGGCHDKDQPHGELRSTHERCDKCHSQSAWTPQKTKLDFDHDDKAQAAMKLEGAHADVSCGKCHPKAAFKLADFDNGACSQCHDSPHDGQIFSTKKCQSCHSPALRALSEIRFNHKKETGYAVLGKHAQIDCDGCHTKSLGKRAPKPACESCHANDNKHGTRFDAFGAPPPCTTCHGQRGWKTDFQFNHATSTQFALTAKHAKTACRSCHRGKRPSDFERFEIKNGCMSCHRHEQAHGGKFQNNECLSCHEEGGSKTLREDSLETFHGEESKFPLRGGHTSVQCQLCHANDVYKTTPSECGAQCHEDSLHKGTLGDQCSRCHEPGQWPAARFDHAADTEWKLAGKHAAVKDCDSCHPGRQYAGTPKACSSAGCHKDDDVHQGQLGAACEKCHDENEALLFRHNRDAQFKIDGAHAPLVCSSCHASIAFKPVRKDCFGCHAEPAIHKGMYGTECESCHSTRTFADVKALHDVGDFSLSGAHDQLDCARCHPRGENLRGSGNLCITCHRQDDIHNNALSPRCGECHGQRAFAPARFDHLTVGCGLPGLHSTLPCADCHRSGNYGAVSPLCVSCHRNDALGVRTPDHRTLLECGDCHSPNAWIPSTEYGAETICR
jgi:hypothetical protein